MKLILLLSLVILISPVYSEEVVHPTVEEINNSSRVIVVWKGDILSAVTVAKASGLTVQFTHEGNINYFVCSGKLTKEKLYQLRKSPRIVQVESNISVVFNKLIP